MDEKAAEAAAIKKAAKAESVAGKNQKGGE